VNDLSRFSSSSDASGQLSAECLCMARVGGRDRQLVRLLLQNARRVRQLAIVMPIPWSDEKQKGDGSLFAASALNNLTYLQIVNGMLSSDWAFLLTADSPPVFASSLSHLLLVCHQNDRAELAGLLPQLPSMYPSLTHFHIGVYESRVKIPPEYRVEIPPCPEWDAAVLSLSKRISVGA
jgi:hypothetical protein